MFTVPFSWEMVNSELCLIKSGEGTEVERTEDSEAASVLTGVGFGWLAVDALIPGMQAWKQTQSKQVPDPT